VLPRTLIFSTLIGLRPLGMRVTLFKWVFIATSTPATVPITTVPFFSSMLTVSLVSFIKNLQVTLMYNAREVRKNTSLAQVLPQEHSSRQARSRP
jgi:hypothetical protein